MKRIDPKKQGNPANPAFDFWIENKISNKRTFFIRDIKIYFKKWLVTKEKTWLQYYTCSQVIVYFISDKSGLNAVCDGKDINEIIRLLTPDYKNAAQ